MKTFVDILKKMIFHFSICFSGIILFFWSFMKDSGYIDHDKIKVFFIFSLVFGLSSVFFLLPKVPYLVKVVLHFITNTIAFLFTFVTIDGMTQSRGFVVGTVFVVLYVIVFLVVLGLSKVIAKVSEKSEK